MKWVLKTLVSCDRKKKYRPRAGVVIANPVCIQGITNVNVTMTQYSVKFEIKASYFCTDRIRRTRLCIRKTLNFEQTECDGENNSQNRKWLIDCEQSLIILCKVAARESQARERRGPRAEEKKRPASSLVTQGQLNHYSWSIYMEALWLADRAFISSVQPASLCSDFVINKWLKPRTNSWRSHELFSPSAMMSVVSVNNDTITLRLK